jgi:hypothetical protein
MGVMRLGFIPMDTEGRRGVLRAGVFRISIRSFPRGILADPMREWDRMSDCFTLDCESVPVVAPSWHQKWLENIDDSLILWGS